MRKKIVIVLTSLAGIFVVLLIIGTILDEGGTTTERIERECRKSYGTKGETAVLECKMAMMVRLAREIDQNQADSTYKRIR